jgi:hypothetical protein
MTQVLHVRLTFTKKLQFFLLNVLLLKTWTFLLQPAPAMKLYK